MTRLMARHASERNPIEWLTRRLMREGARSKARSLLRGALARVQRKLRGTVPPEKILAVAIANARPIVELRERHVGNVEYRVPSIVFPRRQEILAIRGVLEIAQKGRGRSMEARLAKAILSAYTKEWRCDPPLIISGGQTGADRGGLDAAIALGLSHGGWCPRGRLAEDGRIPARYELKETRSADCAERTKCNVKGADGTVLFSRGRLEGGSALTAVLARKYRKPFLHVDLAPLSDRGAQEWIVGWVFDHGITVFNVAGQRESEAPGIQAQVKKIVMGALRRTCKGL